MTDTITEKIFGLIGFPLGHSKSQEWFNNLFESQGINARYLNFELPDIGDLMEMLAEYPTLGGFNVTLPYKELIIPYLTSITPQAREIGAVNVVKINYGTDGPELFGYNTDAPAFADTLQPIMRPGTHNALVLGSGGASKAVSAALRTLGIIPLIVSRTPGNGEIGYRDISREILEKHRLIINTTPLGMYPTTDRCPDIPYSLLDSSFLCYDLIYNPENTLFMKKASENGAQTVNGLRMLEKQAMLSWEIWNN